MTTKTKNTKKEQYIIRIETVWGTKHIAPATYSDLAYARQMVRLYNKDGYHHLYGEIKAAWTERI